MDEASWGDAAAPAIDWRMSAALQHGPRGDDELAEVTSLEGAVRAWLELDPAHRAEAILTPERALTIDGASRGEFHGDGIETLASRLPGRTPATSGAGIDVDEAG